MTRHDRRLEALAEAITKYSGYLNPQSPLYYARNPGGLKGYPVKGHKVDEFGNRIFPSLFNGLEALLYDLEFKIIGKGYSNLKPKDTLIQLAEAYEQPYSAAQSWTKFLRHALRD